MPGAKQYDRIELLDRAIELFRREGYTATTTAQLVDGLGVNRKSMYAEFGSKQELFEAALERYSEHQLPAMLAPIEAPDAGADAIREAFLGYGADAGGWASGRGCLMCNTAVERAALDPGARRFVDAYLERLERDFRTALLRARDDGDLAADADVDELAAFLAMSLVGVSAMIRAAAPPEMVQRACRVVIAVLD